MKRKSNSSAPADACIDKREVTLSWLIDTDLLNRANHVDIEEKE
ncbi:MAG: hypothetical protein ACRC1N_02040 [Aeromonas sobria]|nr:hypothetical protein [Aeromonas sobria]